MKAKELKGQSDDQLAAAMTDTEKHLFQLRFQSATDRLETPSEIRKAKKDIARILTEQSARRLKAEAGLPDAEIAAKVAAAAAGEMPAGTGRRVAARVVHRLHAIQTKRDAAAKKSAAPAGKGK